MQGGMQGGAQGGKPGMMSNGGCAANLCCGVAKEPGATAKSVQVCNLKTAKTYKHTHRGEEATWAFVCTMGATKLAAAGSALLAISQMM